MRQTLPEQKASDDAHEEANKPYDPHCPRKPNDRCEIENQKREYDASNTSSGAGNSDSKRSTLTEPVTNSGHCRREQKTGGGATQNAKG